MSIEHNIKIMKNAWVQEIIDGLEFIEKNMGEIVIESILKSVKLSKVADTMSAPMLKQIYNYFLKDLRDETIKQLDVFIEASKLYDGNNLDELVEQYRKKYLKHDITAQNLKKKHKNYSEIIDYQIKTFKHRIIETSMMMKVDGANTYEEIIKKTYPDYKTARKEMLKQISFTQKAINLIIKDMSILKIPEMLKRPVIDVLKMGYKHTLDYLLDTCKELYSE
ncbi:MAG: hypothetical protein ACTSVE_04490 [Candidatus Helarchaeota archaeon]